MVEKRLEAIAARVQGRLDLRERADRLLEQAEGPHEEDISDVTALVPTADTDLVKQEIALYDASQTALVHVNNQVNGVMDIFENNSRKARVEEIGRPQIFFEVKYAKKTDLDLKRFLHNYSRLINLIGEHDGIEGETKGHIVVNSSERVQFPDLNEYIQSQGIFDITRYNAELSFETRGLEGNIRSYSSMNDEPGNRVFLSGVGGTFVGGGVATYCHLAGFISPFIILSCIIPICAVAVYSEINREHNEYAKGIALSFKPKLSEYSPAELQRYESLHQKLGEFKIQ